MCLKEIVEAVVVECAGADFDEMIQTVQKTLYLKNVYISGKKVTATATSPLSDLAGQFSMCLRGF